MILANRAGDSGYTVLLTKRPESMKFMGGTHVFPGGALDDADCGPDIESLSALSPADARERIGEDIQPERALGLYCAAVRELFEEVGVLLARTADGAPVDPMRVRNEYLSHRDEAHEAGSFARFLRREGLTLATDELVWHGRLITPEASPIRFDARFFVAELPGGQTVLADPGEVEEVVWMTPADAMSAAEAKTISIPIPTMSILQGLSEVTGFEQLMQGARVTREILTTELSDLVTTVLAPNPSLMTGAGTNTYIIGRGETVIVDPAVPDPAYIEAVAQASGKRGRPVLILITHLHHDHIGGAEMLATQMKVPVAAWKGVGELAPYVTKLLDDGDVLTVGGATILAIYTPGHESRHLCYLLEEERALFAGDVVAGSGTVVIAPPDGSLADYMDTLERLASLRVGRIYPGHGPVVEDGAGKLEEYIAHRRQREAQVVDALQAGVHEIPAMVKRIYKDVPESLHGMAQMSALAHLEVLERAGRARRDGEQWHLVV